MGLLRRNTATRIDSVPMLDFTPVVVPAQRVPRMRQQEADDVIVLPDLEMAAADSPDQALSTPSGLGWPDAAGCRCGGA
jgi:hypothetical protein